MVWAWVLFLLFVFLMLALDLGVFHREAHAVKMKEALRWSAVWVSLSLAFSIFIYFGYENRWLGMGEALDAVDKTYNDGVSAAVKYLTGYIVEISLSMDNLFVILMIFRYFGVPALYQHRVLFWGILGALVMRGAMIVVGAALIAAFHWILYLFALFLIYAGVKMLRMGDEPVDPEHNYVLRLARRLFRVTVRYHGNHFVVRAGTTTAVEREYPGAPPVRDEAAEKAPGGTLMLTPLALALIVVETTDVLFAVDSIPAIFAITADPNLVFTSNVFAILGLRSLFFALANLMDKFRFLKVSLALVLVLVGAKMLVAEWFRGLMGANFNFYLLGMVVLILAAGVAASLLLTPRQERESQG
ncbi:MAG: TerC/Alx family metal homeostasis membrane protein [Candidatus Tectomicrobia bacterium]|uniref:TerC/Alx family metal homeostasis membrane protein n=1 Tax=Tectimicrobiota bacterium TaxID=2528274 RepID=A0A932ZSY1_UNCTE|nr:TerC/Alx family metal homeostasis membrane protein [Candidatus Tectomicrobia bacterium]MBI4251233.1 TerC/Alx family metal homeostasis membrane protein [Candidatus Tectomicrobia bacterium]